MLCTVVVSSYKNIKPIKGEKQNGAIRVSFIIHCNEGGESLFPHILKICVSLGFTKITRSNQQTNRFLNII